MEIKMTKNTWVFGESVKKDDLLIPETEEQIEEANRLVSVGYAVVTKAKKEEPKAAIIEEKKEEPVKEEKPKKKETKKKSTKKKSTK